MKIPEVRINFSWLLYSNMSEWVYEKTEDKSQKLISYEEASKLEKEYQKAWAIHESRILNTMQEVLGVKFYKPVIDVALAPMFIPQSDPLIINFGQGPDQFVGTLTHELFHVLLTDNDKVSIKVQDVNLLDIWTKMFGKDHSWGTLVHIPVHAGCKYIFTDILKQPERIQADIDDIKTWGDSGDDYLKSWEYVNSHDYKKILADLKANYESPNPR